VFTGTIVIHSIVIKSEC